jgi:hypothetical protein
MPAPVVVIDLETRSMIDLRKVGACRYGADPTTDVWCAAYAIDDSPVELWTRGEPPPPVILEAAADPGATFTAHNVSFERALLRHVLEPHYGWPTIPIERWRCTMAATLALALPPRLAKVAEVLSLSHRKGDDGIMHVMARPRFPRGDEDPARGPYWFDDPEHLQQLYDYCKQDVECERDLYRWLPELSQAEQELWCLDQAINDAGFYTDGAQIDQEIAIGIEAILGDGLVQAP